MVQSDRKRSPLEQIYAELNQKPREMSLALSSYKLLHASKVFNEAYYVSNNDDVLSSGLDPLAHYVLYGLVEGRNPGPLFHTAWYLETEGKKKRPQSDFIFNYFKNSVIDGGALNPLFVPEFYRRQAGEFSEDPITNYILVGADAGLNPSPLFETAFYLKENDDVRNANINPLIHYLVLGNFEGRSPHPLFDGRFYLNGLGMEPIPRFLPDRALDSEDDWLRAAVQHVRKHRNKDLVDPIAHYMHLGWREKRNPHPLFSISHFQQKTQNSDVEPLESYLTSVEKDTLSPHPLFDPQFYLEQIPADERAASPLRHYVLNALQNFCDPHPFFKSLFYIHTYPDCTQRGQTPLGHYLLQGHKIYASPNPTFDAFFYSHKNKDFAQTGLTPVEHYVMFGEKEGRAKNELEWLGKLGFDTGWNAASNIDCSILEGNRAPLVSFIVHAFGDPIYFRESLSSICSELFRASCSGELIVIDETETGLSKEYSDSGIQILRTAQDGNQFGHFNEAAKSAKGQILVFLNDGVRLLDNWLRETLNALDDHRDVAVVGGKMCFPNGRVIESGASISSDYQLTRVGYNEGYFRPEINFARTTDFSTIAFAVRKEFFEQIGGFDPSLGHEIFVCADFNIKLRENQARCFYAPNACAVYTDQNFFRPPTFFDWSMYESRFKKKWSGNGVYIKSRALCDDSQYRFRVVLLDSCTHQAQGCVCFIAICHYARRLNEHGFQTAYFTNSKYELFSDLSKSCQRSGLEVFYGTVDTKLADVLNTRYNEFDSAICLDWETFERYQHELKTVVPGKPIFVLNGTETPSCVNAEVSDSPESLEIISLIQACPRDLPNSVLNSTKNV